MRITFLGTGAAGGMPLFGCQCVACQRAINDARFRREPCSALVEAGNTRVLIDAGLMDLHRRFSPGDLDAILLTHFHADHVQGLFHLRWGRCEPIPVFIPPDDEGCSDLFKHPGIFRFRPQQAFTPFKVGALTITPVPLAHSKPTFGYHIQGPDETSVSYLTDTCGLPPDTREFLRGQRPDAIAVDCSFPPRPEPKGHNDWHTAHGIIQEIQPRQAWLTHIGHELDQWLLQGQPVMADSIHVALDGDIVELETRHHGQV